MESDAAAGGEAVEDAHGQRSDNRFRGVARRGDVIRRFLTQIAFRDGRTYLLVPARANGQPAVAAYLREPGPPQPAKASSLLVLTLAGTRIQAMTRFDRSVFPYFGLPPVLAAG